MRLIFSAGSVRPPAADVDMVHRRREGVTGGSSPPVPLEHGMRPGMSSFQRYDCPGYSGATDIIMWIETETTLEDKVQP